MDNYIKIKKIGEGSFGRALLVKRKSDGKQCVVKEIGIAKMPAKEREESKKEVKVLSQLKHPNIVNYLESFQGDGNLYIVMDYCEAGDLYQHIVKQRGIHLEESKVLDIFVQCCLAIKHIHDRKILHRDIKTQNIFLTRHYIVKLGDFGIARVLKSTMELARTCIGTPYYLSPEIVENRPYNNKSDIWSLGCVLYELATLKHAFEAGSMKNLVLKIVRGSYPPVPSRYSFELRSLVAQCFKRSPSERPSINSILKKPIIQQRISKYLSPEEVETEFSHTVLHREKFNMMTPVSRPSSVAKKPPAGKRLAGPAAVYGVSVAKKPMPLRKPLGMIQADARQKRISGQNVKVASEKRKEIYARERRRKDLVLQEQQYQEYMAKIQKQRWEKQQAAHISRAREAGWKSVLSTDEKKLKAEIHDVDIVKNRSPMKKYQAQNEEKVKEEKKELHAEEKPVVKPVNAWSEDVKGFKAEDAAERGRVLEEFWQRKKEAAEYKARGHQDIYGGRKKDQETNPLLQFHNQQMAAQRNEKEVAYPAARNKQEVDYLKQLEEIRKQNYIERKVIQGPPGRLIVQRNERVPDPRYDPDARKKKIEALKEQAEQRSKMLRQQLEARKKQVEERMMREQQQRLLQKKNAEKQLTERPLPLLKEQQEKNEKFATPSVGLETAMNQVNHPKLFRSCSEGDLSELVKPVEKAQRKNWGDFAPVALALVHMPLEITSSAMEATVADVESSDESRSNVQVRKHWIPDGRTQLVSMLHNIELSGTQMPTVTMKNDNNSLPPSNLPPTGSGAQKGDTITLSPKSNTALPGDTITISPKRNTTEAGRTVVIARSDISCINDSEIPIASAKLEMSTNSETIALKQKKKNDEAKLSVSLEETPERRTNNEEKIDNNEAKIDENEGKIYIDEMNQEKNEDVNDKNEDIIDISANETRTEVEASPKIAWCAEPVDEADSVNVESCGDVKEEEEEKEEDSFHTPNRVVELQTGCYDIEKKLLRTCSLPDLRNETNFREPVAASLHGERSIKSSGERRSLINNDDVNVEDVDDLCADGRDKDDDHQSDSEAVDEEYLDSEEEEFEDFESMLESMRDVLKSTAHSPSSTVLPQVTSDAAGKICSHVSNKRTDDDVEEDGDVWESEDGEEDEKTTKQTDAKLKETLFSRIEESRKVLEDELGLELFLKIYRHVQSIQDNEDDELELGTTEISHLLGDKEYLYQKILYLVMADTAYCEGNDGIC